MTNKKPTRLRLATEVPIEELKIRNKGKKKKKFWAIAQIFVLVSLILVGNYILLTNRYLSYARVSSIYPHRTTEHNRYEPFANSIVRFNRDGVMLINSRNQEMWVHPGQFANPVFAKNGHSFLIADKGGNSVKVFNRNGVQGEFETFLPIERITISNQGIVSAILRNDSGPLIITYDMAGTILVEKQVPFAAMGYPTALALSDEGTILAVAYLSVSGGRLTSRIVHYNFTNPEEASEDYIVNIDVLDDTIVADIITMDGDGFVAITDNSFVIYQGSVVPTIIHEIPFNREVRSVFYTRRHFGYIASNLEAPGYEVSLFDLNGQEVFNLDFVGEYSNVNMIGNDIIMFEGMEVFIISRFGVVRFHGSIDTHPLLIKPALGVNRYHVMTATDMLTISLFR